VILFISTIIFEMDRLSEEQRDKLKRTSTDRLRIQLCKTGYDEEKCLTLDRQSLMEAVAGSNVVGTTRDRNSGSSWTRSMANDESRNEKTKIVIKETRIRSTERGK
jgi:hypothetical protein